MTVLRSLIMAFACFSRIPMPTVEWRPESMRFMLCFFPLIGAIIGGLICVWLALCDALAFGDLLRAGGVTLIPIVVTGGIHLDGFADVVDAQSSHASPERKREILKDPHAGAFAIIAVASYILAYFAFATELSHIWVVGGLLVGMHMFSRVLSGIATSTFPKNEGRGMLAQFHDAAEKSAVVALLAELVVCIVLCTVIAPIVGASMIIGGLACVGVLAWFARSQFGGMSGDLAGWFLQVAELVMLACLVVVGKLVGL